MSCCRRFSGRSAVDKPAHYPVNNSLPDVNKPANSVHHRLSGFLCPSPGRFVRSDDGGPTPRQSAALTGLFHLSTALTNR